MTHKKSKHKKGSLFYVLLDVDERQLVWYVWKLLGQNTKGEHTLRGETKKNHLIKIIHQIFEAYSIKDMQVIREVSIAQWLVKQLCKQVYAVQIP